MGSGKGKARRTRTTTQANTSAPGATRDRSKWEQFLKNGGVQNTKMVKYYPCEKVIHEGVPELDWVHIVTELFQDAVAVGAISLPEPYSSGDFEFSVVQGPYAYNHRIQVGFVEASVPPTRAAPPVPVFNPFYNFAESTPLSSEATNRAIDQITGGITQLLRS